MRCPTASLLIGAALAFTLLAPARAEWQPGYHYGGFYSGGPRTAVEYGGKLAIGGRFSGAGGVQARGVIFFDDETFSAPGGPAPLWAAEVSGAVNALAVHGGDLVAAGEFAADGPTGTWTNIARFDGSAWRPLGPNADLLGGRVDALQVFEGDLVAIGEFTSSGDGTLLEGAASWDGTVWQPMGVRPPGAQATAVYNGELWCGFSRWDGAGWQSIATFGPDGSTVTAMGVLQRGLAIGGTFETVDGAERIGSALVTDEGLSGFLTLCEFDDPDFLPDCTPRGVGGFSVWRGKDWVFSPQSRAPYAGGAFLFGSAPGEEWVAHPGVPFEGAAIFRGAETLVYRDQLVVLMDGHGRLGVGGAVQRNAMILEEGGARPLARGNGVLHPVTRVERYGSTTIVGHWDASVTMRGNGGDGATEVRGESINEFVPTPYGLLRLSQHDYNLGHVGGSDAVVVETNTADGSELRRVPQHFLGVEGWSAATAWDGGVLAALKPGLSSGSSLVVLRATGDPAFTDEQVQLLEFLDEVPTGLHAHGEDVYLLASGGRSLWLGHAGTGDVPLDYFGFEEIAQFDEPVASLASWQGKLVAAGQFSSVNVMAADGLAILASGTWTAPYEISGEVLTLEADPRSGALWVGGAIDAIDGEATSNLFFILDDEVATLPDGPNGVVRDITVTDDGILVGGDFTMAGGLPSDHLAEWKGDPRTVRVDEKDPASPPVASVTRAMLHAPWPNPFNPRVTLSFSLPAAMQVELEIFDLKGRRVNTLVSGRRAAGPHDMVWDGTGVRGRAVSSGAYLAVLTADGVRDVRKLMLVR